MTNNLSRLGGIAAILGILLSIAYTINPVFLGFGALAFAVFIFALYRIFSSESAGLSLAGAVVGIAGAALLAFLTLTSQFQTTQSNATQGMAMWATFFFPPLVFGYLAYRHPGAGMPRTLGLIGLLGGVFGLLNAIFSLIGGGDWMNPNNPALSPFIMGTYLIGMVLMLVWLAWTVILLMRRKD